LAKHRAQRPYERKIEQLSKVNKPKMAALILVPPLLLGTTPASSIEQTSEATPIVQEVDSTEESKDLNTQLVALDTSTPDMYYKSERRRAMALEQMNAADAGLRIQAQEAQAAQERIDAEKAEQERIIAEQKAKEDAEQQRLAEEKRKAEQKVVAVKKAEPKKEKIELTEAEQAQASKVPDQELSATESFKISETVKETNNSDVFSIAERYIGVPYKYGGTDPDTGIDCSAYVRLVYSQLGVDLPRTSGEQAKRGVAVSADEARPGDLVFFGSTVHHVGIYAGNGKMIDSRKTGTTIDYRDMWYTERIQYRRVL